VVLLVLVLDILDALLDVIRFVVVVLLLLL